MVYDIMRYGIVGFVWQMGHYKDEEINLAISQIVWKYLSAVVVEGKVLSPQFFSA